MASVLAYFRLPAGSYSEFLCIRRRNEPIDLRHRTLPPKDPEEISIEQLAKLSGGPGEFSSPENMYVQVKHALARVFVRVDDEPVTVFAKTER